jgi:hypothetical protein
MQTPIIGNVSEDPVTIASSSLYFHERHMEDNIQNLYQQNLEKEARNGELEEKLQSGKYR